MHPGANHELVHFYETVKRPALGWPYAQGYMKSSPGVPHAFHMQAHLATRVGKWTHTTDWSRRAVELETAYHATQGVKPADDHQYSHHLEILTRSLLHDGRFAEAREVRAVAERADYHFRPEWFRLELGCGDRDAAERLAAHFAKTDKPAGAYYRAVLALDAGDPGTAAGTSRCCGRRRRRRPAARRPSCGCGRCRAGCCARPATPTPG